MLDTGRGFALLGVISSGRLNLPIVGFSRYA